MVYTAIFTGLRVSELAALRWRNIYADSITIEQRLSRGDWDVRKSEASKSTIPVNTHDIERIEKLKSMEILVRAGRAHRRYPALKSTGPDDLLFSIRRQRATPCGTTTFWSVTSNRWPGSWGLIG